MKIAIIVAMQKELHLLLGRMGHDIQLISFEGHTYYFGTLEGHEVIAATCGIGKVNAALGTEAMIRQFAPDLVINTGVAGGVGAGDVHILDAVLGVRVAYHDVWCGPGTQWGEAADCPLFFQGATSLIAPEAFDLLPNLRQGLIASGDIFVSRSEEVDRILSLYPDAKAVDMESGAVMQTCFKKHVPALVVRVISDTPGSNPDNIGQYEHFWEDAPKESMDTLMVLLRHLQKPQ